MPTRRVVSLLLAVALLAGCSAHHGEQHASARTDDTLPTPTDASVSRGSSLFAVQCAACHGAHGNGGPVGPSLLSERRRKDRAGVVEIIEHPSPPMPKLFPGTLGAQDVADIAAYVESL